MTLTPGTRLGVYEVTAKIGEGGMGEVYQARDTKLDRDVALKVLPEAFSDDPERLARFEREAKVLASLNHPNIGGIHGLEDHDGARALVLEFVEGPTLADRIRQGPMPVTETVPVVRQIADALDAAHEAGVIHRDLKPANVKVTPDGTVKVLDFGLAKAMEGEVGGDPSASPTLTAMSQVGTIMGTAAYMAPEQARGEAVDRRADIWSFGVVLFEMLTARRPFEGRTVSDTLASVLAREPDLTALPSDVPPAIRRLLRRCLEKEPKQRLRDIAEGMLQLEEGLAAPDSEPAAAVSAPTPRLWQRPVPAAAIVLLSVSLTALSVWGLTRAPSEPPVVKRFVTDLNGALMLPIVNTSAMLAVSPDGTRLVSSIADGTLMPRLYVRPLDQVEAQPIPGTDRAFTPFFSPDGSWVGFFEPQSRRLMRVSMNGGNPLAITEAYPPLGAAWLADGTIIFTSFTSDDAGGVGLFRVPESGGAPVPLAGLDPDLRHAFPRALPGGTDLLVTMSDQRFLDTRVAVIPVDGGTPRVVIEAAHNARYVDTGHLLFARDGALWAVGFDLARLETTGAEVVVLQDIQMASPAGFLPLAVSPDGSLVYVSGEGVHPSRSLVWVDRQGVSTPVAAPARSYAEVRIAPDGTRAALTADDGESDIWVWDLERETLTRVTSDAAFDWMPSWTPDGRQVVFSSTRRGTFNLFRRSADGTGTVERLTTSDRLHLAAALEPGGTHAVVADNGSGRAANLIRVALDGTGASEPLLGTEFNEGEPALSPDGRWLAYGSDVSGLPEVYLRSYPDLDGQQLVSVSGGRGPVWRADGRELYYRGLDGDIWAVPIQTEPTLSTGTPNRLFGGDYYSHFERRSYDVAPDGQRFLMITPDQTTDTDDATPRLIWVENWVEELKTLVPTP